FAHERLRTHEFLEGDKVGFRLARQMHHGEDRDFVAELLFVEQRAIALDEAGFLQRTDAAQTGRRGNTDTACQLHVRDAAFRLPFFQDFAVDRVEAGWHRRSFWPNGTDNIHTAKYYFAKQYCAV